MMEEIIEKINRNNLEAITQQESEIIATNNELLELFKEKLKNFSNINILKNMSEILTKKIILLSDFLEKALDFCLENDFDNIINDIVNGSYTVNNCLQLGFEIDNNTEKLLNEYKIKHIPQIISYYNNNEIFAEIEDEFLINYIINNKIYQLANVIAIEYISNNPLVEQFIIDANINDNPIYLLYFINTNVVNQLIKVNKIYMIDGNILFDFINEYPEYKNKIDKSINTFLESATEEQLNINNFCFNYIIKDKELTNSFLTRLTKINSNLINTDYKYYFLLGDNPYFDKLLFDESDPLNIDFNTYMHFFKNEVNNTNINLYLNSLTNKNIITLQNIDIFLQRINKFDKTIQNNIIKLLINNGNFNKVEFYKTSKSPFYKINDEIWIEYFKNKNNIPISIFEELQISNNSFDAEESINNIINNCDDDYYLYDYSLFQSISNDSKIKLYNNIIERLNNKRKVNFYYFLDFILSNINIDYSYLNNSNIIFNIDIYTLHHILKYISKKTNNHEFTNILINKLETYNEEIPIELYNDECLNNPFFKHTLLKFIINKKVNINSLINNKAYLNKDVLTNILNTDTNYIRNIITNIIHRENTKDITDELFNIMLPFILNTYNIDKAKFLKLVNSFGIKIISLLENKQFIKIFNYNNEQLDKFIEIFKVRTLDKNLIVTINDSLKQNIFAKDNQEILTIYTTIVEKIQNGINDNDINNYINILLPYLNNLDLKKNLINYYKNLDISEELKKQYINNIDNNLITLYDTNKQLFFINLFKLIKTNQNIYGPYLHIITNKYIFDKRNEFAKDNDITIDTNILFNYDRKQLADALFNYLLKYDKSILKDILNSNIDNIDDWDILDSNDEHIDWEKIILIDKTLEYLTNPSSINNLCKEEITEIKKNIKLLKEDFYKKIKITIVNHTKGLLTIRTNNTLKYLEVDFLKNIKKEIIIPERILDINEIFKNINIEVLFNTVINNHNKFNTLIAIIDKYKILEWGDIFNKDVEKLSISSDNGLYTFIDAFDKIYDQEVKLVQASINEQIEEMRKKGISEEIINKYKSKHSKITINPYKILKYCSIYSGFANCYKIILGIDDYELIKNNDGPNSAKATPQERLENTCLLQIKMMQNNEITIPSFIKSYETTNNKLMVIVGNKCAPFNLTHGERTGACMRSLGYADALFKFCNTDPRGFHITFVDPETNEYVSRVSGFRNGNTVFLNQLRFSVSPKYSDKDIIIACKEVAKELIELSKNSKMPIENVVVSPTIALEGHHTEKLSEVDIGAGVYKGYRDVSDNAVILATTSKDNKPMPLKLNPNQPIYKPVRLPVLEYKKCNLNTHINIQRIKCLKQCILNNEDKNFYKKIDIDLEEIDKNYLEIYIGQDWFVTVDSNLNIEYEIIPGDDRAKIEIEDALNKANLLKEQYIGGKTL